MNPRQMLNVVDNLGWRASLTIIAANVRLYGWTATVLKILKRGTVSRNFQMDYERGLERLRLDEVDQSSDVFSRPCILIVGPLDLPQCKKYRVLQKVEFFNSIGWACHYAHYLDEPRVISYLQISTAIIFYRVPASTQMDGYLGESSRLGVKTFYDIDDPIFSEEIYSENNNLEHLQAIERTHLLGNAVKYREAMEKVGALVLSTSYLRTLAASNFKQPAYLWRNLADAATLSMVEKLPKRKTDISSGTVVIGYASGSRAHDEDFKSVSNALAEILATYQNVSLHVIGYLALPPALQAFKGRINMLPFAGYLQYLESVSQTDISIVPLIINRFNECKSAIRYIEASLCEVPTIASTVGQFSEIIISGKDGYLASNHADWLFSLKQLINNESLRRSMGIEAREKVMRCHLVSSPGAVEQGVLNQFSLSP